MDIIVTFLANFFTTYFVAVIIIGIIFGIATQKIIANKGYYENWFWWGFFFWMLALIVALSKPEKHSYYDDDDYVECLNYSSNRSLSPGEWRCAFCNSINQNCVISCSCGKSKDDTEKHHGQVVKEYGNLAKQKAATIVLEESKAKKTDSYEEVKKVKELLDMGIITQEEFDKKKSQLLDL